MRSLCFASQKLSVVGKLLKQSEMPLHPGYELLQLRGSYLLGWSCNDPQLVELMESFVPA